MRKFACAVVMLVSLGVLTGCDEVEQVRLAVGPLFGSAYGVGYVEPVYYRPVYYAPPPYYESVTIEEEYGYEEEWSEGGWVEEDGYFWP